MDRITVKGLFRCLILILILIPAAASYSKAQPVPQTPELQLSLKELWEQVSLNSKTLAIKDLEVLQSKEELKNAGIQRLPDISLDGEYAKLSNLPQYERGIFHSPANYPIAHTTYSLGTSVYFNLYNGGTQNRNMQTRKVSITIREQQRQLSGSEIRLLATAWYLDILRGKAFLNLLAQDIAEQNKVLAQIKVSYKNGVVLKSDVLRTELKLSKQQLLATELQNDISIASQKISLLMGKDENMRIEPADPFLPDTLQLSGYANLLQAAASGAREIRISKEERRQAELQLKQVKSHTLPQIGLFANYAYSYPQGRFYPYVLSLYGLGMVGIKASYSISALFKNKHQVSIAAMAVEQNVLEHLDIEDQIKNQLKEAYLRLQEGQEKISVAKINIIQATENLRVLKNSYINQTSLITDYLDADVQLLQSKFDLSAARIAVQLQYYQLQKILGTL